MTIPLTGGRLTPGVVRIGDTVRRPAAPFAAGLLHLLEERGLDIVPRYLGADDEGRDILTYLDGWVPAKFQRWADPQLAAAGRLLRVFHDATRNSPLAGAHEVVCHHDPGPNNFVFQDDLPTALIDFDLAEPGDPLEDLGYAAWTWCIASKHGDVHRQAFQVRTFVEAYDLTATRRHDVIAAVLKRQLRNAHFWRTASVEVTATQRAERIEWSRREHAFTAANREAFEQALL